jgi:hypothetical protein
VTGSLVFIAVAAALFRMSTALAFMLTMEGPEEPRVETASVLYATAPDGQIKRVLDAGTRVADGGVIADFGNPAIASDGSLIFGALLQFDKRVEWRILRADSMESSRGRIEELFNAAATMEGCRPLITSDPRVAIGGDGSVVFVAADERGRTTLFRFAKGQLACELRAGERTAEGHVIANLGFGTAQVSDDGSVALLASLAASSREASSSDTRRAILLAGRGGIVKVIAREGDRAPDGRKYGSDFGAPAIVNGGTNLLVAFTNHDHLSSALFVGRPGHLTCALITGAETSAGPLTYLSNGRPSLAPDGSVAFEGASRERSMILGVRAGEPFLVASMGDRIGNSHTITGLADPTLMRSGRVYAEAADQALRNGAYSFSTSRGNSAAPSNAKLLTGDIEVFPSSWALDRNGGFAFLSRLPHKSAAVTAVGTEDGASL